MADLDYVTEAQAVALATATAARLDANQAAAESAASSATTAATTATDIGLTVAAFGAVSDGTTDDTAAVQATIDAAPIGGIVMLPPGNTRISTALAITKALTLRGSSQYISRIYCDDCNGVEVAEGVSNFRMENIEVACVVRHSTTPNTLVGVKVEGVTGSRPSNHLYRDVYIDGFETGFDTEWLWSSRFENARVSHCKTGIHATGLSVNNFVTHGSFGGTDESGGKGIYLDGNVTPSEGWTITETLIDSFEIAIDAIAVTHCKVAQCILDHCGVYGVLIRSSATNFGGNWEILGNYIGIEGTGTNGIGMSNAISNTQNAGNRIIGNYILAYSGSTLGYGIRASGAQAINNIISANTIRGCSTADIRCLDGASATDIITNNTCLSGITNGIYGGLVVADNIGTSTVLYQRAVQRSRIGKMQMTYDQDVPTTGTWARGDICWNTTPSAGGAVGWVCVTAGTPGTWKIFGGTIEA